jgi:SAM-dependent methyltransferase
MLPNFFKKAAIGKKYLILDAGCGNGMLTYHVYLKGNRVIGISFKEKEIKGCRELFNLYLGIPDDKLEFRQGNLYELDFPPETFDEIICSEVLEHMKYDQKVCRSFWRLLKPGGILHLCAPNAEHPYNASFPLDKSEKGGHVRSGYSLSSYNELLLPVGFQVVQSMGLGGPVRQWFNRRIKEAQEKFGPAFGFPLFLIALLFLPFENKTMEHDMPFSIYVKAIKSQTIPFLINKD